MVSSTRAFLERLTQDLCPAEAAEHNHKDVVDDFWRRHGQRARHAGGVLQRE